MSGKLFEGVVVDGVIQGRAIAAAVRRHAAEQVKALNESGIEPTLCVIRVGDDPASQVYVRGKVRACNEVGIRSLHEHLPATISESDLLAEVARKNDDPEVDGILVQLPLPDHIHPNHVIEAVDPVKDVDGFHPSNLGLLIARHGLLEPCTPSGIMVMLDAIGFDTRGKRAVVVGRSVIVGRPIAQLLMRADATVTVCHRYTRDLEAHVRQAELLVVATGVPGLIKGEWIREGAVVIDVGINRMPNGKLRGDVEFDKARERAAAITPVPGGVGPMTVAMLLWNTIAACVYRRQVQLDEEIRTFSPPVHRYLDPT